MSDESSSKSFTVKDRRRFTSDGELKGAEAKESPASEASDTGKSSIEGDNESVSESEQASQAGSGSGDEVSASPDSSDLPGGSGGFSPEGGGGFEMNFSSFVISLATQALCQLGEAGAPEGFEIPVDHAAAKQTIEILRMLQDKTKGNLVPEEARLVEEVLHQLQMTFVKATTAG